MNFINHLPCPLVQHAALPRLLAALHHPIISGILLWTAVILALICCIGLLVMRDAFQRLHFTSPPATISSLLIAIAVLLEDNDPQARIKAPLIFVLLFTMNAILTHATARAAFIRHRGHWEPTRDDQLPVAREDGSRSGKVAVVVDEDVVFVAEDPQSAGNEYTVKAADDSEPKGDATDATGGA